MKLSDKQLLEDFFSGKLREEELTPHLRERMKRVKLCVSLLLEGRPNTVVVKKLEKVFGISVNTAYLDIRLTKFIFGKILKGEKEMYRAMAIEMALADRRAAIKKGDLRSRNAATRNFIDASGIKNEDPDLPDFGKLRPSVIVALLPEGAEQKIDALLAGGVVDLNDLPPPTTIDVAHEEVDTRAGSPAEGKDRTAQ